MKRDLNYIPNLNSKEGDPLLSLTLWPHRSLEKTVIFKLIVIIYCVMLIPILPFLTLNTMLIFLPFSLLPMFLLYFCLHLNLKEAKLYESINIWPSLIEVRRYEANGNEKVWNANPYWTATKLYPQDQKVENYLTLRGNGREVELGSFLNPEERIEIKNKIDAIIQRI